MSRWLRLAYWLFLGSYNLVYRRKAKKIERHAKGDASIGWILSELSRNGSAEVDRLEAFENRPSPSEVVENKLDPPPAGLIEDDKDKGSKADE